MGRSRLGQQHQPQGQQEPQGPDRQSEQPEQLSAWQLICRGSAEYVNKYRDGQASLHVQNVLAKISLCRSGALGGRWYQCDDCRGITKLYNSCGERHCPACSGGKRRDFSERAEKLLIDGVEYYQVVFTLPAELSSLALGNRSEMADLLFQSAWKALRKTIRDEQGYEAGALMVLHTWNQKLEAHWHVHALVPAAGPAISDGRWKKATAPPTDCDPPGERKYLVDAINLRQSFRKFAVKHLQRLRHSERLSVGGSMAHLRCDAAWDTFIDQLKSIEWVSHIEPPPSPSSRPRHVVRYLTRYLTGGPISDYRITAANEQNVTILAREGTVTGGESTQVSHTIPTPEFVRRWCLHILPDQLTKTRQFGGWSNTKKEQYLEKCRAALKAAGLSTASIDLSEESAPGDVGAAADDPLKCEHCGSQSLQLTGEFRKPSWRTVLARQSTDIPAWYAESLRQEEREFWDRRMGTGFSDFYDEYLETQVEVTKGAAAQSRAANPRDMIQLTLPGIGPTCDYWSESF